MFNEPNLIETTLASIYELRETPFELFIINDGAGRDASAVIQSVTEYYDHAETFVFEYESMAGIGMRVNEVLPSVTGDFVWIANSLGRIDESELQEVLSNFAASDAYVSTVLSSIPGNLSDWLEILQHCNDLQRQGFLWKWNAIPSHQRFFNPYLLEGVSFELAWRLEQVPYLAVSAWFQPAIEPKEMEVWAIRRELALHWLRTYQLDAPLRNQLIHIIEHSGTEAFTKAQSQAESLLDKAREERSKGNLIRALNFSREAYLQEPDNELIRNYHVEMLEYLGRYVEASEIKHGKKEKIEPVIQKSEEKKEHNHTEETKEFEVTTSEDSRPTFKTGVTVSSLVDESVPLEFSIIIPTTGYGLGLMENVMESLANTIDRNTTEIIVIDNASLDETYALLEEIKQNKSFRLKVITNHENKGFAFSVNQGIDTSESEYILVLHNDTRFETDVLHDLKSVFESHADTGLVVPLLSASLVKEQDVTQLQSPYTEPLVELEAADSACFMMKKADGFRLDEQFGLAYFDDVDLCEQVHQAGKKIYLNTQVEVKHDYGVTTGMMGLSPISDYYALNFSKFNKKWGREPQYDPKYNQLKELDRVLIIASLMNPVDPELHLFEEFKKNFTDEVKTEILQTKWDKEYAIAIASMLIKTDQRDVLRKFEVQLDAFELPIGLVQDFVRYYYSKNIFSRCSYYLSTYGNHPHFVDAAIYQLKIYLGERLLEEAAAYLEPLYQAFPGNPELYKLTGDFHKFQNNPTEAQAFYDIAAQIDPFRFGKAKASVSFI